MTRFERQIMLPEIGPEGQQNICKASVLIVGLGGLGCPVALYLAGAGVGRIGLADADSVSISNLHRQLLYSHAQIGVPKADAARQRLVDIAPESQFDIHPCGLNQDNAVDLISQYDLIVDCCDNYATRFLIDKVCKDLQKPWIMGSISGFHGMVSLFGCRQNLRYTDLFSGADDMKESQAATGGVIGPTPGVLGSIQAAEAIKYLAGIPSSLAGKLFTIDLLSMSTNLINLE